MQKVGLKWFSKSKCPSREDYPGFYSYHFSSKLIACLFVFLQTLQSQSPAAGSNPPSQTATPGAKLPLEGAPSETKSRHPEKLSAEEILKQADEIRSPSGSFRMKVAVESPGEDPYQFEIHIAGKDASLIKTLSPKREVGKNFLMLKSDMWAFIPNLRRSVRVTLNQKLTGQAVNGDIGRMRWYGDYAAKIESETSDVWVLYLTALKQGLTYDQIRLKVSKKDFHPIHGEYLTQTGKPLKKITFNNYQPMAGALRPVDMVIENAQKASERSQLKILDMAPATFPAEHFTQGNLQ